MGSEKRYVYGIVENKPLTLDVDEIDGADAVDSGGDQEHAALVSDIERLDPEHADDTATIQYSGTWPPSNFVDVEIGIER